MGKRVAKVKRIDKLSARARPTDATLAQHASNPVGSTQPPAEIPLVANSGDSRYPPGQLVGALRRLRSEYPAHFAAASLEEIAFVLMIGADLRARRGNSRELAGAAGAELLLHMLCTDDRELASRLSRQLLSLAERIYNEQKAKHEETTRERLAAMGIPSPPPLDRIPFRQNLLGRYGVGSTDREVRVQLISRVEGFLAEHPELEFGKARQAAKPIAEMLASWCKRDKGSAGLLGFTGSGEQWIPVIADTVYQVGSDRRRSRSVPSVQLFAEGIIDRLRQLAGSHGDLRERSKKRRR